MKMVQISAQKPFTNLLIRIVRVVGNCGVICADLVVVEDAVFPLKIGVVRSKMRCPFLNAQAKLINVKNWATGTRFNAWKKS